MIGSDDLIKRLIVSDHIIGETIDHNSASLNFEGKWILDFKVFENITYHEIVFEKCVFEIPVWFKNMDVNGLFCFENCVFNNRIIFNSVNFKSDFLFRGSTFNKEVNFSQCSFIDANFIDNDFNGNLLFDPYPNRALNVMNGVTTFRSNFNGYTSFRFVQFDEVSFEFSNIGASLFEFINCQIGKFALFRRINFGPRVTFDGIDISVCSFLFSNFKEVNFSNCEVNFTKCIDEIFLGILNNSDIQKYIQTKEDQDPFIESNDVSKEYSDTSRYIRFTLENLLDEYRKFEINYDINKDYEKAGAFHQRRFELLRIDSARKIKSSFIGYYSAVTLKNYDSVKIIYKKKVSSFQRKFLFIFYQLKGLKHTKEDARFFRLTLLSFYKWSSDYGENYGKSLIYFVGFFILFTFIYLFSGLNFTDHNGTVTIFYLKAVNQFNFWNDLGLAAIYSLNNVIPFKKDLTYVTAANGWTTFFTILESFILTILASLFVIGLRRKFKR